MVGYLYTKYIELYTNHDESEEECKMKYGCQSMVNKIDSILIKKPEQAFISQENLNKNYEAYNYIGCPNYEKSVEEYDVFEKIIRDNVENVYYLPENNLVGLDSIYAHDSLKVTKRGAIYFPMGKELRKNESRVTEEFLKSNGVPTLGHIEAPGKMEGGDVVWIDEKTVAIGCGYRTNYEGIKQFKELTQDFVEEYIVVETPYADGPDACLHLMSIISLVDKDLAVVYSKYMPVVFRNYLIDRGIKLIDVDDKEYDYLGCNVLAIAPRKVVIIDGVPNITKKLREEGCEVFTYPGKEVSFRGTGGPTCFTCPITRE